MNTELTKTYQINRLLPLRDNTTALWRFRDNLVDSSGNDEDLTAVAIGSYVSGGLTENVLTAIAPTGPAGPAAKILAATATSFDFGTGSFTIEVIISTLDTAGMLLVDKSDGGSPLTGFYVGLGTGVMVYKIGDGSHDAGGASAAAISDSRWHYVAVVFDRTNDLVRIYVDGLEDAGSPDSISTVTGSISEPSEDFEVGNLWNGRIDEIAIHPQALSAAEIAARAAGTLSPLVRVTAGELKGYLRGIDDSPVLDEALIPFEYPFAALRQKAKDVKDLVKFDQVQERHLPALASLFNFELPDKATLTITERREMFKWITWLYQWKGTYLCVDKLIDLAGLSATTVNRYPDGIPFTLNVHRLFGFGRVEQTLFSEDFSGNMSQWDPPLESSLPWRLTDERLYCKVGNNNNYDNCITFDNSSRRFYIEANVKLLRVATSGFGFYLAYEDSNNWVRLDATFSAAAYWTLRWSDDGSTGSSVLGSSWDDLWDTFSIGDTIKLWIHADLDTRTYTVGIDETTLRFNFSYAHPDIVGSKKGLWLGYEAEVEWDNITVKNIRLELAATLPDDNYRDRTLEITYAGTSVDSQKRKAYVAAVLPRYIPYGVIMEWVREIPGASRIGFRTGSFVVKTGWVLSANKAVRIGLRTAGITAIRGDIIRTPDASRFGLRTLIGDLLKSPGGTRIGLRTGDITKIKQYIPVKGHINNLDTDRENEAFGDDSRPYLIDGDYDTPMPFEPSDDCSIGLEFAESKNIDTIILYDLYTPLADGLYESANNKLKVYSGSSDSPYVLEETFDTLTRTGSKIVLSLATTITAKWIKIFPHDGKLRAPDYGPLRYTEIEAYED